MARSTDGRRPLNTSKRLTAGPGKERKGCIAVPAYESSLAEAKRCLRPNQANLDLKCQLDKEKLCQVLDCWPSKMVLQQRKERQGRPCA
eukprot:1159999-Pelagomonas_calceolata.AAC.5